MGGSNAGFVAPPSSLTILRSPRRWRRPEARCPLRVRLGVLLASLLWASAVLAGTTYRFRTVYDGSERSDISGRVWVEGGQARREYDAGGSPPFDENRVEIHREGEAEAFVLDLRDRTFHKTSIFTMGAVAALQLPPPFDGPYSVSDLTVTFDQSLESEPVGVYPARRSVLNVSYGLSEGRNKRERRARIAARVEFWTSDALAGRRLAFGDGRASFHSGIEEVDAVVSARLAGVGDRVVKSLLTATRTIEGEDPETESLVHRITEVTETPVASARFEVPTDFAYSRPAAAVTVHLKDESPQAGGYESSVDEPPRQTKLASAPAPRSDSGAPPGLSEALTLLRHGEPAEALRRLKVIDKAANGGSGPCILGLATAYNRIGAYKDAAAAARRLIDRFPGDENLADGYNELGIALAASKDRRNLPAAAEAFERAATLSEAKAASVNVNLALVLFRLGRNEEARALVTQTREQALLERDRSWAKRALENTRCFESRCPSGVTFVSADGESLDLEDLRGKVVLVTFWASWCAPCVEAVPDLKYIQHRFASDSLAVVGVNVDSQREVMDSFVARNKISWPQCWDDTGRVTRDVFGVDRFPTEVVLDHEGVEVGRSSGWGPGFADRLGRELIQALGPARKARKRAGAERNAPSEH
jgi:thiol-disulfide isomerase/thioredoxin/Flp pilus assembly protein TadD